MSDEHFRALERMYLGAPCNEHYAPTVAIEEGRAEISFDVQDWFYHAGGSVHGSVYFKALDDAAFFAVSSLVSDVFVFTASFNIHLLRPVTWGTLTAHGRVLSRSRNLFTAESQLFTTDGKLVGHGTGSFMRSHIALIDAAGYAPG